MATRVTPLFVFGKWVIIPCALAAAGYFVVAPLVIPKVAAKAASAVQAKTEESQPSVDPASVAPASPSRGPSVDVQVAGSKPAEAPRPRRKKRRRKPTVAPQPVPEATPTQPTVPTGPPPDDAGGSGGAATAGGDGMTGTPPTMPDTRTGDAV